MAGAVHDMTVLCNIQVATYRIAGNFRGRKLLQISWFCAESFLHEFHVLHQFVKVFSLESFLLYSTVASNVGIQTIVSSHEHSVMIFLPVMHSWQNMCHLRHRYPTCLFPTHSTMTDFNPFFSWYSYPSSIIIYLTAYQYYTLIACNVWSVLTYFISTERQFEDTYNI